MGSRVGRGGGGGNLTTSDKEESAAHHLFGSSSGGRSSTTTTIAAAGEGWRREGGRGVEQGFPQPSTLNDTQIDDDKGVRRYGILLTPGDAAQEDQWRIAANGYRRLTMVVVGRRTMTAWNTMTTPKDGRAGEAMGDDGDGSM